MSTGLIIYCAVVSLLGLLCAVRVWFWLARTTAWRLARVGRKKRFEAVPTDSPVDDPAELARGRALDSIEAQFTVTRRLLIPLVLLITAAALGIPFLKAIPASIVTVVLGAITVLLGVSTRPLLENAFAGLVISMSRLVNIGDTVSVDGHYGTIEDISSTHTTIKIWDWRRYLVPNSKMLQSPMINYSLSDRFVWAHVKLHVSVQEDLEEVRAIAFDAVRSSKHFAPHEEPCFWVMNLDHETAECWVAAWANNPSDAWYLCHDTRTKLVFELRKRGIYTKVSYHRMVPGEARAPSGEPPSAY